MDGLFAMAEAIVELRARNQAPVLATLVKVVGSGFRTPGSRMLIGSQGERIGDLSGGCLDGDVAQRADALAKDGRKAELIVYDGEQIADLAGGFGVGCPQRVEVLLRRVRSVGDFPAAALAALRQRRHGAWLASVCAVEGSPELEVGQHVLFADGDDLEVEGPFSRDQVVDCHRDSRAAAFPWVDVSGGRAQLFVERIEPVPRLLLLGGTTIVEPLVRFAKELGWDVLAFQIREDRNPPSDGIPIGHIDPTTLRDRIHLDPLTFVITMEHHQDRDIAWLTEVLDAPVPYIGLLGSRKRVERVFAALREQRGLTEHDQRRLHGPIGLDLGAKSPAEIALAIVAEVQAVLTGSSTRPKREASTAPARSAAS